MVAEGELQGQTPPAALANRGGTILNFVMTEFAEVRMYDSA